MSNFTRKIGDMEALQKQLTTDGFLQAINRELIQTGRLLSAGVKFTRFTEQIIKTLSPIQNKHILFLKIRYKYNYIFR